MNVMEFQVHVLIHVLDDVDLAGVVSCHWMFILGRYMKKLKGFVWKMEKREGSIVEGYIVYGSFYYSNKYIKPTNDTLGEVIWEDK